MSRIPPNLLYLTIYNPTLKPLGPVSDDDEDAEEQAHILFYTSKERAVSRDRMLRQVGLAKALSVELAKVPRAPPKKGKAKNRSKSNEKGKEKDPKNAPLYDYQEGSVHDLALHTDILRGYEQFKLTHGSFTTILSTIGQEALELQLERFFTIWAWTWNLEDRGEFGEHLGTPLHPSYRSLGTTISNYSQHLPECVSSIIVHPPHVMPSPQYYTANHPTSLPRHLLSLIPEKPSGSEATPASRDGIIPGELDAPNGRKPPMDTATSLFLGMPTMNMNIKWGWPAALTFGKGSSKRPGPGLEENKQGLEESKQASTDEGHRVPDSSIPSTAAQGLDHGALADAISNDTSSGVPVSPVVDGYSIPPLGDPKTPPPLEASEKVGDVSSTGASCIHDRNPVDVDSTSIASSLNAAEPAVPPQPPPAFSSINVHLATPDNPHLTARQKIYYIINDRTMLALIGLDDELATSLPELAQNALDLLLDIETLLSEELSKTLTPEQLATVSKILQPTDIHIMSTGQFTIPSSNFTSTSSYLYDAEELQTLDPDISEVFSRGLNPQHWHIARRGLGPSSMDEYGVPSGEEVYMQIFRKEATLSDVDNVLAGVVKCSGLVDATL
ncbi:hypothetical protein C0995_001364 [Termitomyces sp. Mi166|nr:hypothetical protein C0995_001364 [Termitomyces sp. Mi166\